MQKLCILLMSCVFVFEFIGTINWITDFREHKTSQGCLKKRLSDPVYC